MNSKQITAAALLLVVAACSKSSSGIPTFVSQQTDQAMDLSFDPVASGDWAAYRVSEVMTGLGGTDLDGDASTDDKVTFALNLSSGLEVSSNLNASSVHIVDDQFFLVVDELTAGVDLGGAVAANEVVLMHWDPSTDVAPVFVDTIQRTAVPHALNTDERVYYMSDAALVATETNMRLVDPTAPTTPVTVGVASGTLSSARFMGEREGLILVRLDETVDGDLDGDTDGTDVFVLGMLDSTDIAALMVPSAISMRGLSTPFDAEALTGGGWLVATLADEISIGADLNDPVLFTAAWRPGQCSATADGDMLDEVLFYTYFAHPTFASTPVNTGLVGRNRVHVVDELYVVAISPESEANCDLNSDGDSGDLSPRWCAAVDPALGSMGVLPRTNANLMDALVASPSGGSFGLVKMAGNLVALVDEAGDNTDHNGDSLKTAQLIAYVDDLDTDGAWEYNLVDPEGGFITVGSDWLGADASFDRLGIGLEESVADENLNNGCGATPRDSDKLDSIAAWLQFQAAGLAVPGIGFSVDPFNAGTAFGGGNVFFNVDEFSDDFDYNGDGDKNDQVLVRNPLGAVGCQPRLMGSLAGGLGSSLAAQSVRGAVFVADEADAKIDFNKDGDKTDSVLRWIRFN